MSKGMDMLVQTLLKATGLEPEKVIDQFKNAQQLLIETLQNFDNRLTAIEARLNEINNTISSQLVLQPLIEQNDKQPQPNGEQNGSDSNASNTSNSN